MSKKKQTNENDGGGGGLLKVTGIPKHLFCTCRMSEHIFIFTCTESLITQTQRQISNKMPGLQILNEIILCCIFIFFLHGPFHSRTNVKLYPRTISFMVHSIHGPFGDRCHGPIIYRLTLHTHQMPTLAIHGPFHSRTNVKLYPRTISFMVHSIHGPFGDRCHGPIIYRLTLHTHQMPTLAIHGPFHSRTNVKLYPRTISFMVHSIHGPFGDRCHGPIIYRLTLHTHQMPTLAIHGPFHSRTNVKLYPRTISFMVHSIRGPFGDRCHGPIIYRLTLHTHQMPTLAIHGPFHSRTNVKLYPRTISFMVHSIHGPFGDRCHGPIIYRLTLHTHQMPTLAIHGPFHSRTNVKLYPRTISFMVHSIRGPFGDRCHGPIIYRLTLHTHQMPTLAIHGPFHSRTNVKLYPRTISFMVHSIHGPFGDRCHGPIIYRLTLHTHQMPTLAIHGPFHSRTNVKLYPRTISFMVHSIHGPFGDRCHGPIIYRLTLHTHQMPTLAIHGPFHSRTNVKLYPRTISFMVHSIHGPFGDRCHGPIIYRLTLHTHQMPTLAIHGPFHSRTNVKLYPRTISFMVHSIHGPFGDRCHGPIIYRLTLHTHQMPTLAIHGPFHSRTNVKLYPRTISFMVHSIHGPFGDRCHGPIIYRLTLHTHQMPTLAIHGPFHSRTNVKLYPRTISFMVHSIHGPFGDRCHGPIIYRLTLHTHQMPTLAIHGPFHSRTNVKLYPRTISFMVHSIHGPFGDRCHGPIIYRLTLHTHQMPTLAIHGPFHSRTNVKLYPRTISFMVHSIHGPFGDRCHGPIIYRLTLHTHQMPTLAIHGPFHSRTNVKLYPRTISFMVHSIHGPFGDRCHGPIIYRLTLHTHQMPTLAIHGPFHSRTNVKLYPRTISFMVHSIHGPFGDRCHGPIIYRLTLHTHQMPTLAIHGPFHSRTNVKLYPRTISFMVHSIHGPFGDRCHGPIIYRLTLHTHQMPTLAIHGPFVLTDHLQINVTNLFITHVSHRLTSHTANMSIKWAKSDLGLITDHFG